MEWFSVWWESLAFVQQLLFCIALPASLILVIQVVMIILGFGGGGEGIDFSDTSGLDGFDGDISDFDTSDAGDFGDGSAPGDFGIMSLFSIQGIVSFLCVFGWSGLAFIGSGVHVAISIIIAFILGTATMVGVAAVIRLSGRLAQNGTLNIKNLLGETATVYLAIPAGGGKGKVTVQLSERFLEFDAVTEEDARLDNNTSVRITDILAGNVLVVEKIN